MLAIIGGSSLTKLHELNITDRKIIRTPYGLTSSPVLSGKLGSQDIIFLARHGFVKRGCPFFPSMDSSSAVSSPQM